MDAVKFFKEKNRMCYAYTELCQGCPIDKERKKEKILMGCVQFVDAHPDKCVELVEQWSKEHPVMTNRMKIKEVFGCNPSIHLIDDYWLDEEYKEPKGE